MTPNRPALTIRLNERLFGPSVELISPLSVEACGQRLAARMDTRLVPFGKKPVIGRVDGSRLRASKRLFFRNAFQTCLSAELIEEAAGTRIRCRFSLDPGAAVALLVMTGLVASIAAPTLLLFLWGLAAAALGLGARQRLILLIPSFLLLGFAVMVGWGRLIAGGEREFLIAFVRDAVRAENAVSATRAAAGR
jgi:hypothetical protein